MTQIRSRVGGGQTSSGGGPTPGVLNTVIVHTITVPEAAAKQFNLPTIPPDVSKILVDIHQGPCALKYAVDYTTAGLVFNWAGLGLDGLIGAGDIVRVVYNSI